MFRPQLVRGISKRRMSSSSSRSVAAPVLKIAAGATVLVAGTAYAATKVEVLGTAFTEHVPQGAEILDFVRAAEKELLAVDVNELSQTAQTKAEEASKKVADYKAQADHAIESALKTTENLKKTATDGIDSAFNTVHESKKAATDAYETASAKVSGTVDLVQSKYKSIEASVHDVSDTIKDKYDAAESFITGKPRRVVQKPITEAAKPEIAPGTPKPDEKSPIYSKVVEETPAPVKTEPKVVESPKEVEPVAVPVAKKEEIIKEIVAEKKYTEEIKPVKTSKSVIEAPKIEKVVKEEKKVETPVPQPVSVVIPSEATISSEKPLIDSLAESMSALAVNLLDLSKSSSDAAEPLRNAASQLSGLASYLTYLEADEAASIAETLTAQTEEFQELINKLKDESDKNLADLSARLTSSFASQIAEERVKAQALHQEEMAQKLAQQADEFTAALEFNLKSQAETLDLYWAEQVRHRLDTERDGRLARLDHLALKLKYLERISLEATELLSASHKTHLLQSFVRSLKLALDSPKCPSVSKEISEITKLGKSDPLISTVIESISQDSIDHYLSTSELSRDFYRMKEPILKAQLLPPQAGPISYIFSLALSYLIIPKHGLVTGTDTESIMSRASYYIDNADIDSAAREVNQLSGWAGKQAEDWLANARYHLEVYQAVEVIETKLKINSLGITTR